MGFKKNLLFMLLLLAGFAPTQLMAATAQGQINVTATLFTASAAVTVNGALDFGTARTGLTATLNATTSFDVTVTSGVAYTINIDKGLNSASTTGNTRVAKIGAGGATNNYLLYTDNTKATAWNIQTATAATGTGVAQNYTVYGEFSYVPSTAAGTYQDTLTVTVTY